MEAMLPQDVGETNQRIRNDALGEYIISMNHSC